jgi:hypothetical protein
MTPSSDTAQDILSALERYPTRSTRLTIRSIGLEVEGGWMTKRKVKRDSSVFANKIPTKDNLIPPTVGEIVSKPFVVITPKQRIQFGQWKRWLSRHYPHIVDETCGLHVHLKPRTTWQYALCVTPVYQDVIRLALFGLMETWYKQNRLSSVMRYRMAARLHGKNRFCLHEFHAEWQMTQTRHVYQREDGHHRYTMVAYPYKLHGTIEIRVLPMFEDVKLAQEAISLLVRRTSQFIRYQAKQKAVPKFGIVTKELDVCV